MRESGGRVTTRYGISRVAYASAVSDSLVASSFIFAPQNTTTTVTSVKLSGSELTEDYFGKVLEHV